MMDRAREGRRTASSGLVSAPRRPRTTLKDSPVHDDDEMQDEVHNSRLRERIKKDSLVSVVSSGAALRNKRKRQEAPAPSAVDEADESSDDTDGATEEDDDPPPPIIPRWPGKARPGKFGEEGIGLDLPAVPRKARSAIVKRHQESPQLPNATSHHSSSPSTTTTTNIPSSTYNSSGAGKPGRRMKPNGSKPRPAKVPKSSPAPISEQEVEVAEALFDLARMVPNTQKVESGKLDSRAESKTDRVSPSPAKASSSPAHPGTPLSPSVNNVTSHPAEAPRRKRPRIRPRPDEGGSGPSGRVGLVSQGREHEQGNRNSNERKVENFSKLPGASSTVLASPTTQAAEPCDTQSKKPDNVPEVKPSLVERKNVTTEAVTNVNTDPNKRKLSSGENRPAKFEIDLMAPPSSSMQADMMETDIDRKEQMDTQAGAAELFWLEEHERLKEKDKEKEDQKPDESETKKEVEAQVKDEREFLDLNKQGMVGMRSVKGFKMDAKSTQKADRSVSAAVVSAASSFLNATTGTGNTTPARTNWPGGYYAPPPAAVAAAAAQAAALTSTEENSASHSQMMPYLSGRHTWKRCAIHVFIARFIDLQQQVARHSFMASFNYGGKPYNLNIPADAVFANGGILPTANGMGSSVSSGLALGPMPERNTQQSKTGPYIDTLFRKHPSQQQQQQAQTQAFGFPVAQNLPANASGSTGSPASNGSGNSSVAGSGSSNVASMAAQAQFFQAVMQHNPFPFPFPTSHFGSQNFNGAQNLSQQAAQFVNNPFYASHLVHTSQQQNQSQKQQGGRVFSGLGSQQQQLSSSAYASSLTGALQGEKDGREQRLMFVQQSGPPNLNVPPVVVGPDGSQDYSSLGGKHVGKLQSGSVQHSGVPSQSGQHSNAALQMNLKGMESQAPQVHSSSAASRVSVGPGPLGLAPVAAVMAPQGHAVLQGMADQGRMHPHGQTQTHLHAMQAGQQQQQPRLRVDELYEGQSNVDERKLAAKRSAPISRVDLEALPMQASPTNGSSSSRMANAAMNLLPAGTVSSRLQQSQTGAAPAQQAGNQNMKQVTTAAARTKGPPATAASTVPPFSDRSSLSRSSGAGMPFPAQGGMPTMQASKQNQGVLSQHPQLKLSQRPSAVPVPGASVIAANIPKNQVQPARSPQSSSPANRLPPASSAPGSPSVPVSQVSKQQQGSVNQKNASKSTFPLSQKPGAVVSGKRSPATPTMLNAVPQIQQPSKGLQQQQQQQQQLSQQPLQSSSPQHSPHLSQQQHASQKQQLQMRQSQMFLHQQYMQQQQQQQQQPLMAQQQGIVQQLPLPQSQQGSSSPSTNGLSLGSQGLSLGSGSNGTPVKNPAVENSYVQAAMAKAAPPSSRTPSGSPVASMSSSQQQRVNGTVVPVLQQHQTGSPSSIQQQFSVGYSSGGPAALKASELKNDSNPERSPIPSSSSMPSPLKSAVSSGFSNQAPGRPAQQQQQQQQPGTPNGSGGGGGGSSKAGNYGESGMVVGSRAPSENGGGGGMSLAATNPVAAAAAAAAAVAAANFVNSSAAAIQQQGGGGGNGNGGGGGGGGGGGLSPMPLAAAAAVASGGAPPGLLGQSSASALRP